MSHYETLLTRVHELDDLGKANALLQWDREVNMPAAGTPERIAQSTTLSSLIHRMSTSDEMGELIERAAAELNGANYDSDEAALIRLLRRNYADARKLPPEYVARSSRISGQAREAWVKARAETNFAHFRPWLEQIVALCQELAGYYGYEDEPYDALLDKYETDTKTAEVRAIFAALKADLVPLREAIDRSPVKLDDSLLHQPYDVAQQQAFARYIATALGYDFSRGHLGTVVHPFATSFSRNDARITTRWYPDFLSPSLFGTLHECGHAMYEQGTAAQLARTPLARGTSSGVHESQSRMMENLVGRSRGFWQAHFPTLQTHFPEALGNHTAEAFYQAINKTQPSFIRVEADELTYNFHIILRFELEQALLNGDLVVADLPAAWNDKMREMLGVTPPNDSQGCLQDVHWTRPGFGYFPTYALGNLYAAQWYEQAAADDPTIPEELSRGQTTALLAWLRQNIHRHGRKFTPGELVRRITGKPLSHEAFMRYAKAKFGELYQLG
jgi:carboxypeptidase Taq